MRNLKKFLALVLAMMMTLSLMVTVNAATDSDFTDKDAITENFAEGVEVLKGMGVFEGYTDGSFQPKGEITRAEVATIVYRLATGDWQGNQAHLYKDYVKFDDVQSDHWAAGYINYCANAEWIAGYGNGNFGPNDKVTGYQAAAMILRAVGYGKNGEFQGNGWQVQVANVTRSEGLLKNVDNTTYANTLNNVANRELVAEILFQAAQIPTVTWTMLGGYNKYTDILGTRELRDSLGYINYGLTKDTGIVLGNQATGEDDTLIGFAAIESKTTAGNQLIANANGNYKYDSNAATDADTADGNITVPFDAKTGLDMFGHKADVWYDGRDAENGYVLNAAGDAVTNATNKTYAIFDKAVLSAYVYAEDEHLSSADGTNTKLGAAAADAGFSVVRNVAAGTATGANTTTATSDEYMRIDTTTVKDDATATDVDKSKVNMYALVSNSSGKTVDVVVTLNAEVGQITEKNTTAKDKYLILGTDVGNVSAFGNANTNNIYLANLTPDSVQKIGELVTAWEVKGTTAAAPAQTDWLYQLDAMKTVTKQVSSFVKKDALTLDTYDKAVTKVNFTDGTSMELSGITFGSGTASKIVSAALPIVTAGTQTAGKTISLAAGKEYTVYVDVLGRFISMTTGNDVSFIYGTFGDFEMGALGAGTNRYTITGVDKDGNIVANHDLTAIYDIANKTMKKIVGNLNDTYSNGTNFPITKKDYSGDTTANQIKEGANTAFLITKDGQVTMGGGKTMNSTFNATTDPNWAIKTSDVSLGVAKVVSNSTEYLLTENTQFYVVEGSGTASLKVTPYKGIKAFLGDSASLEIDAASGIKDQVVFWTEEDVYGTVNTDSNHNVAKVILSDTNLTRWGGSSMFYSFNQTDATGLVLPGAAASVAQYELYANGEKGTYFIDTSVSVKVDDSTWGATTDIEKDTFYTLTKVDEVNGIPVYKAVAVKVNDSLAYADGLNTGVTYNYIAVNNLNFAELNKKDATDHLIFNVANAKICDVEYKDGKQADASSVKDSRNEITTIAELNNAISVMKTNSTDPVYGLTVAVVYDSNNVATIYITALAANP